MTTVVVFADSARRALIEILDFIALDKPQAALDFIDEVEGRVVGMLAQFPEAGARYQDDKRFVTVRGYSVVYRHDAAAGVVQVLDVFGAGRNWR